MNQKTTKIKYFLYARKSSEAEDKQVASIDSQLDELKKLAKQEGLFVADVMSEAKSAKAPGREVFNEMLERIQAGEAQGIICWKLDRLARNPIDGGQISWMLQKGLIEHIQTFGRSYLPTDNVLMMSVEFGMANQFIRDLSTNVKRGLNTKVQTGWAPYLAPAGYLNTPDRQKGMKVIIKDPEKFDLIRKMWDLMLSGQYMPLKIWKIASDEWGLTNRARGKHGGKPITRSYIYKIFNNTFYAGRFEYPKGSNVWHEGGHDPMVTQAEFDRVQILLGRKAKYKPKTRTFAFTGLMKCGECDGGITAEEKHQLICPVCKLKFLYLNKEACPECKTKISDMNNPKILKYIYYRCTKNKGIKCSQPSIRLEALEGQISEFLSKIQINQKYLDWAIKHLQKAHEEESGSRENITKSQQGASNDISKKLDKLLEMRLAEELSESEYTAKKAELLAAKAKYEELLRDTGQRQNNWLERSEQVFNFAHSAKSRFVEADMPTKREILSTLGSNLILKDKILNIKPAEPFSIIEKALIEIPEAGMMLEPKKHIANTKRNREIKIKTQFWGGIRDLNP